MLIFTELITLEVVKTEDMNISFNVLIDVQLKKKYPGKYAKENMEGFLIVGLLRAFTLLIRL